MAAPRYGLSLPNRGVLYGVTTVQQILDLAAQARASCPPGFSAGTSARGHRVPPRGGRASADVTSAPT